MFNENKIKKSFIIFVRNYDFYIYVTALNLKKKRDSRKSAFKLMKFNKKDFHKTVQNICKITKK